MKYKLNFKNFIKKIKPNNLTCIILTGFTVGVSVSIIITLNTNPTDNTLLNPSGYSTDYKSIVGDYLIDTDSSFKVISTENENVSLESPFVKKLQDFSIEYINTLSSDKPELNLSDFYLKKDKDTFELIEEDLNSNEPLYMLKKSNLNVVSKDEGFLSADGSNAILKIVFEFTVEDILIKNDTSNLFEVGSTYTQERTLSLKKSQDGSYKIYEIFISSPIKK